MTQRVIATVYKDRTVTLQDLLRQQRDLGKTPTQFFVWALSGWLSDVGLFDKKEAADIAKEYFDVNKV